MVLLPTAPHTWRLAPIPTVVKSSKAVDIVKETVVLSDVSRR